MTLKMPSLLKAENRSELAIYSLKTIKRLQDEVIAQADKKIGDVESFEKKNHMLFQSLTHNTSVIEA